MSAVGLVAKTGWAVAVVVDESGPAVHLHLAFLTTSVGHHRVDEHAVVAAQVE